MESALKRLLLMTLAPKRVREGKGVGGQGGNFKGGILRRELTRIKYIHKPFHNAALALETLALQMKNSEQV